jgi:hypothetical protein
MNRVAKDVATVQVAEEEIGPAVVGGPASIVAEIVVSVVKAAVPAAGVRLKVRRRSNLKN